MIRRCLYLAFITFAMATCAHAEDLSLCGRPPSENVMKELSEKTKGDIEGKAQALTKYLGSGELGGRIEIERRTLYQTGDQSEALRNDRYLFYVTCVLLMKDTTGTLQQKLEAIQALRRPVAPAAPSKSDLMRTFLAEFSSDTTIERTRELLGAPTTRFSLPMEIENVRKTLVIERYSAPTADVYLADKDPITAIAVFLKKRDPPTGSVPVPFYHGLDGGSGLGGLGDFTLEDLKGFCRGTIRTPALRYGYLETPPCYFGRPGRYQTFVFSFPGYEAWKPCFSSFSILADVIEPANFDEITCPAFWRAKPYFVSVYLGNVATAEGINRAALDVAGNLLEAIHHP